MSETDELQAELIAEQIRHILDVQVIRVDGQQKDISRLEKISDDHELRLRSITETTTTFRSIPGLLSIIALILSIAAGLKAFFGGG